MPRLADRIALVTGAGSGIGAAIARRFRAEGAQVAVNDIDGVAAERIAKEIDGFAVAADVADSTSVRAMIDRVAERFGRLDILVNNAGIAGHENDPNAAERFRSIGAAQMQEMMTGGRVTTHWEATATLSDAEWRRMIAVHLDGTFYCTREVLRILTAPGGVILNMGSIMGTTGGAGVPGYAAAKAGILGLTRAHAREFASRGIRVNALAPGWIETPMTAPLAGVRRMLEMQTPLGRLGTADEIAAAALYLSSDEAAFVTGQVLSPNGGWTMNQ